MGIASRPPQKNAISRVTNDSFGELDNETHTKQAHSLHPFFAINPIVMKPSQFLARFRSLTLILSLSAFMLLLSACEELLNDFQLPAVEISPNPSKALWGFQILSLEYDPLQVLPLQAIWINTPNGSQNLITEDNLLYSEPGLHEIELCAQCLPMEEVTLTFEFGPDYQSIAETYVINHQPEVQIDLMENFSQPYLDASGSFDPEGMSLSYTWYWNGQVHQGSQLPIEWELFLENPAVLTVSDGVTSIDDLVSVDDKGNLVYPELQSLFPRLDAPESGRVPKIFPHRNRNRRHQKSDEKQPELEIIAPSF